MGERLPIMVGDDNPMRKPEVAKKLSKWRQGKNVEAWIKADVIREIWLQENRPNPTAKAWAKKTGFPPHSLKSMVISFLEGWVPVEDQEWVAWKLSVSL